MCFVFIWEETATCATYSISWLVFITEMKSVYSAVRTGSLNKAVCASYLKGQRLLKFRSEAKIKLAYLALAERVSVSPGGGAWSTSEDPPVCMIKAANAHTSPIGRLQAQWGAQRNAKMPVFGGVWEFTGLLGIWRDVVRGVDCPRQSEVPAWDRRWPCFWPCWICGGQTGTARGFAPSTCFPCHCRTASASYPVIYHRLNLILTFWRRNNFF